MSASPINARVIVVGGHTRSIGKTQLVCDIVAALPEGNWIAGKITQFGHGVCAQNGHDCDCAPDEHSCAFDWERNPNTGTDSSRFLAAGAHRSFWLRTKQGFLAEGMPLLRAALENQRNATPFHVILESNTLLQFLRPDLFLVVLHPAKSDFKDSAKLQLDRASAFVLREPFPPSTPSANAIAECVLPRWQNIPPQLFRSKPNFLQRESDPLPPSLLELVRSAICNGQKTPSINK